MSDPELTAAVSAVWAEVLQRNIGDTDKDFFALGGNSLMAVELLTQIERTFGVDIDIAELYESPTISGVAQRIGRSMKNR